MAGELRDAIGKTVEERFAEIGAFFLAQLRNSGIERLELYSRPKPGEAREPTEEEVVLRWAELVAAPVNDILIGIRRAFDYAREHGAVVTSFRYCVPHIQARLSEVREARAGLGPQLRHSP